MGRTMLDYLHVCIDTGRSRKVKNVMIPEQVEFEFETDLYGVLRS